MSLFDKHFDDDDIGTCEECGKELPVSEMNFIEDYGWVCSDCAGETDLARCSKCGELFNPDDCSHLEDGSWVCMDCDGDLYWSTHKT